MTKYENSNFKRLQARHEALSIMRSKHLMPSIGKNVDSHIQHNENLNRYKITSKTKLNKDVSENIARKSMFYIDSNDDDLWCEKHASQAYIDLATLISQAREEKAIYLNLSWPVGIEWIGLSQAIASMSNAFSTENNSCRVALYPSIQSSYARYNKTHFPMQDFLDEGRRAANENQNTGKNLELRQLVYLHLNQLEHDKDPHKNPAISNALSIFEWNSSLSKWELHGKGYFSDVSVALHHHKSNTKAHKEQIKELSSIMADPVQSKEAIFRLSRGMKSNEVKKALLEGDNQFDVIIIDARKKLLNSINSWRSLIQEIIVQIANKSDAPSLLLLTDSPEIHEFFISVYWDILKKKKRQNLKPLNHLNFLRLKRDPWTKEDYCYTPFQSDINMIVDVTHSNALFDIKHLTEIARSLNGSNPIFAGELFKSIGFLRRILSIPVGQNIINTWINLKADSLTDSQLYNLGSRYSWARHSSQLYSKLQSGESFDDVAYKKFFTISEAIVEKNNGSYIDKSLIESLNSCNYRGKKIFILVDEYVYVDLVYTLLIANFSDEVIKNIHVSDSSTSLQKSNYDHLIIAGGRCNRIQKVILCRKLPKFVTLLIDAYSAVLIKRNLSTLRAFEEFSSLHNRIDHLLAIVTPKVKSIEQIGEDISLPIDITISDNFYESSGSSGTEFAVINLSGFESLAVGEGTTLIKKYQNTNGTLSFLAVTATDIAEGDEIVILGESQRNQMNEVIKAQAGQLTSSAEEFLVNYFELAAKNIESYYTFKKRTNRARAVFNRMKSFDKNIEKSTNEVSVNRWIKHIEDSYHGIVNHNSEPIYTNSPKSEWLFLLFARALYFEENVAKLFWNNGVRKLRVAHILEGRKFGQDLKKILTGSISKQDLGFNDDQMTLIYEIAKQNSYPVEIIIYKSEDEVLEHKTNLDDKDA